jgi:hypothetical protein
MLNGWLCNVWFDFYNGHVGEAHEHVPKTNPKLATNQPRVHVVSIMCVLDRCAWLGWLCRPCRHRTADTKSTQRNVGWRHAGRLAGPNAGMSRDNW